MKEYIAFAIICFIVLWSFIRGYKQWRQGRFISGVFFAVVGAYALTQIITKLGEWL